MSEKEKRELLEAITQLEPEHKAFVTGYAAGVAAKAAEAPKKERGRKKAQEAKQPVKQG